MEVGTILSIEQSQGRIRLLQGVGKPPLEIIVKGATRLRRLPLREAYSLAKKRVGSYDLHSYFRILPARGLVDFRVGDTVVISAVSTATRGQLVAVEILGGVGPIVDALRFRGQAPVNLFLDSGSLDFDEIRDLAYFFCDSKSPPLLNPCVDTVDLGGSTSE